MGIDFHEGHDDDQLHYSMRAHWSYSGFNHFRMRLSIAIGIALNSMIGFGGNISWAQVDEPIRPLLDHSDCEGELTSEECGQVAPQMRKIVGNWPNDDFDRTQAELLAGMMERCAEKKVPLIFC